MKRERKHEKERKRKENYEEMGSGRGKRRKTGNWIKRKRIFKLITTFKMIIYKSSPTPNYRNKTKIITGRWKFNLSTNKIFTSHKRGNSNLVDYLSVIKEL